MKRYVIEKDFEYKGFKCSVILQSLGHRCGYVNLENKQKSKYYGADYTDIPIDVHGGLTYGASKLVEHDDGYWIGWDYAHYGDRPDYEKAMEYFKDDEQTVNTIMLMNGIGCYEYEHIYSLEEVERDCKSVVDQLIKLQEV